MSSNAAPARIAIVMGSRSDWSTMQFAAEILTSLDVPFHVEVVSAHRTPDKLFSFAETAADNGYQVIIAGAGGAAHLPGMLAAKTLVPVLGVPVQSAATASTLSCRCRAVFRSALWRSAKRARPTPRCWRRRSWRSTTRRWPRASATGARRRPTRC